MNEEKGFPVNPEPVNGYEERNRTICIAYW